MTLIEELVKALEKTRNALAVLDPETLESVDKALNRAYDLEIDPDRARLIDGIINAIAASYGVQVMQESGTEFAQTDLGEYFPVQLRPDKMTVTIHGINHKPKSKG